MRLSCTSAVPATQAWAAAAEHRDNRRHTKRDKPSQAQRLFMIAEPQTAPKRGVTHQSFSVDKEQVQRVPSLLGSLTSCVRKFSATHSRDLPGCLLSALLYCQRTCPPSSVPLAEPRTYYPWPPGKWEQSRRRRAGCTGQEPKASMCTAESLYLHRMFWLPCSSALGFWLERQLHFLPHAEVHGWAKKSGQWAVFQRQCRLELIKEGDRSQFQTTPERP